MKKLIGLGVLVAIGIAGIVWFANRKSTATVLPPKTRPAERGDLTEKITVTGRTTPKHVWFVGPEMAVGKVKWIGPNVEVGALVREGDPLVKFDDELVQAQIDKAKADKDLAETDKRRAEAARDRAEIGRRQARKAVDDAQKYYDTVTEEKKDDKKDEEKKPADSAGTAENHNLPANRLPMGPPGAPGGAAMDPALVAQNKEALKKKAELQLEQAKDARDAADAACNEAQAAVDAADARIKAAEVGITVAKKAEKPTTILAPATGTVIKVDVMKGQIVSAQATPVLIVIGDLSNMQIRAQVGESDVARVTSGMAVRFKLDAFSENGVELTGKVARVDRIPMTNPLSSKLDPAQQLSAPVLYPVVIDIDPSKDANVAQLPAGLTANVDFILREAKGVLHVPSEALGFKPDKLTPEEDRLLAERSKGDWKPLWVHPDGAERQLVFVKTGLTGDGRTAILEVDGKLEVGMRVIIEGPPVQEAGGLFGGGKMPFKV
jgi:multidrug efflux pump subunit AcrA (membrane-fusion protein)